MTDWTAVRARIKAAREANGWTQRELGERIGVTTTRIGQLESGIVPSEKVLGQLAEALGRSPAWLRYGIATPADAKAERVAGFSDGYRAALAQLQAMVTAMQPTSAGIMSYAEAQALRNAMPDEQTRVPDAPPTAPAQRPARRRANGG